MKNTLLLFIGIFIFVSTFAQTTKTDSASLTKSKPTPNRYIDYGLIRVQGNVALGKPLTTGGTNIYIVGDLDIYLRDNISISSGYYYFLGSYNNEKLFNADHMVFFGASYHFKTNNHIDPYFGILPAISVNQLNSGSVAFNDNTKPVSSYPWSVNPLFAVQAGMVYYANRFFNVFINVKYQTGKAYSDIAPVKLDEVKISFGLGYMIWARKHWVRFRKPNDKSQ